MRRLALLAAAVVALLACAGDARAASCTRVAHPGADLDAFTRSLRAGDVGCLRSGTYGRRNDYASLARSGTASRPVELTTYPGDPPARIVGQMEVAGNHVTVRRLLLDGPAGVIDGYKIVLLRVDGDHAQILDNEIRRGGNQGIYLETAYDALVARNYVHDNGDFPDPARANLDHGIYFASGSGLVENNVVADNYAYGIQLYPSASSVTVRGNVIYGQGRAGLLVAPAEGKPLPRNDVVAGNLFADNALGSVQILPPARATVRGNLSLGARGPAFSLVARPWG
jgi:parallel beta-helix repeat protein